MVVCVLLCVASALWFGPALPQHRNLICASQSRLASFSSLSFSVDLRPSRHLGLPARILPDSLRSDACSTDSNARRLISFYHHRDILSPWTCFLRS
jgi:hypothetical protein